MPVWLTDGERDDKIFYTFTYPPAGFALTGSSPKGSEIAFPKKAIGSERNPVATCGRVDP